VATSIESDIDNLINLMTLFKVFPEGLFVKEAVAVAKQELALECDYRYEARCQGEYRQLLAETPALRDMFVVPEVVPQLSSQRVIAGSWVPGIAIDQVKGSEQGVKNFVGTSLLKLTLQVSCLLADIAPPFVFVCMSS
jgi:aarF domain-containing kinase